MKQKGNYLCGEFAILVIATLSFQLSAYAKPSQPLDHVVKIAVGRSHACALTDLGAVLCWGGNFTGQLGDGTTTNRFAAVPVLGLSSGVIAISTGDYYSCAMLNTGSIKCWGDNYEGELGDGTTQFRSQPVEVSGLNGEAIAFTAGGYHACALLKTGKVKCWGYNRNGEVGDGTTYNRLIPVDVQGLSPDATMISAGTYHTCAVTTQSGAKCWGDNYHGQLGDGTTISRLTPVDVSGLETGVITIATGGSHTCAVMNDNTAKCWGLNDDGQLGNGTEENSLFPRDTAEIGGRISSIAAGGFFNCAVTDTGVLKCWGRFIGDPYYSYVPTDVFGVTDGVSSVSTGEAEICILLKAGNVQCWGKNYWGQLGMGSNEIDWTMRRQTVLVLDSATGGGQALCSLDIAKPSCLSRQRKGKTPKKCSVKAKIKITGNNGRALKKAVYNVQMSYNGTDWQNCRSGRADNRGKKTVTLQQNQPVYYRYFVPTTNCVSPVAQVTVSYR